MRSFLLLLLLSHLLYKNLIGPKSVCDKNYIDNDKVYNNLPLSYFVSLLKNNNL